MNIKGNKVINQQVIWNISGQVIPNVLTFALIPVFTSVLGTSGYGLWSIYIAWLAIIQLLTGLNIDGTMPIAQVEFDKIEKKAYCSAAVGIACINLFVILILVVIFMNPITKFLEMPAWMVWLLIFTGFGMFLMTFATNIYIQEKNAAQASLIRMKVTGSAVLLSLCFILVGKFDGAEYKGRIIGYSIPYVIFAFTFTVDIIKSGGSPKVIKHATFVLKHCLPLLIFSLSNIILAQSDRVMLQKLLGNNGAVGVYSAAYSLANVLSVLWVALDNTWVPFFYEDSKNRNKEIILERSSNYFFVFTATTIGFILFSPEVFLWFSGIEYSAGTVLLPVFALNFYLIFCCTFPVNFEYYHKHVGLLVAGSISTAVLNIYLNLVMIPHWSIYGAGVATLLSYTFLVAFHWILAPRLNKKSWYFSSYYVVIGIVAVIGATGLFYLFRIEYCIRWTLGAIIAIIMIFRFYKRKGII